LAAKLLGIGLDEAASEVAGSAVADLLDRTPRSGE
jgi:hypothetical protein